ncbi:uncharacterized protein LOC125652353 [Ostrea edulis]|uniref:uncharacterized protein LOC125652353 n=1 Tax=Ostrea edulis TaxID=37623 RepID=UPI0024AFB5B0|nr:uncharacterized protein LOC125652353 [Ostrea edulis]
MDSEMKKMGKKLQKTKPLDFGTDEHVMETKGPSTVNATFSDQDIEPEESAPGTETLAVQDKNRALALVRKLWALEEDHDIPVAKVEGENICDTDIRSLRPGKWLTDMVMDSYITLLTIAENDLGRKVLHYMQTKMTSIIEGNYTFKNQAASQRNQKNIEELDAEIIIGSYYRSSHWTLVVVEMKNGNIYYYNPCGERVAEMKKIERNWRKYIQTLQTVFNANLPTRQWRVTNVAHSLQKDSFNCGMYCLIFADKHLNNKFEELMPITVDDLNSMRITVADHLMLYEVYLTGCCPKCGFDIADDEYISCCNCQRSYHLRSYCIEKELVTDNASSDFECSLCKINWPVDLKSTKGIYPRNPPRVTTETAPKEMPYCSQVQAEKESHKGKEKEFLLVR